MLVAVFMAEGRGRGVVSGDFFVGEGREYLVVAGDNRFMGWLGKQKKLCLVLPLHCTVATQSGPSVHLLLFIF